MKSSDPTDNKEGKPLAITIPDVPRYPKPKILLVDLKDDSETVLKTVGYTVAAGTFGTPYITSPALTEIDKR